MLKVLLFVVVFIVMCGEAVRAIAVNEYKIDEYVQAINDFIESTKTFTYPTDSREFLNGQSENITNNCVKVGEYDFVIIGAGSAGSVIASRLSEIKKWRVLLIEAGEPETEVTKIPGMAIYLRPSKFNWGYMSVPQNNSLQSYVNHSEIVVRGKSLGGCSAINSLIYSRGNQEDYNLWATLGNPGWSYKDVLKYFKTSEDSHIYHPDPGYHGFSGPLNVEQMNIFSPLSYSFLEANKELGRNVLYDYNGRTEKGFSIMQSTSQFGRRDSSATAFLTSASKRANLNILINTLAIKILINNKTAYGVQYVNNGISYCVRATKEVILSGGTINSPQLLMLSGIGPKEHLQNFNISVVKNLPGVGGNMWNHVEYIQYFTTNFTFENPSERELVRRYLHGQGYYTSAGNIQDIGFVNLYSSDKSRPDVEYILKTSRMPNLPYEYYKQTESYTEEVYASIFKPLIGQNIWSSLITAIHPTSRGDVRLKTKSPFDFPLINPGYFTDPQENDINVLIAAYKDSIAISKTLAMQKYNSTLFPVDLPACRKFILGSDDYIKCLLKNLGGNVQHLSGSCKMGPKNDTQAVVDNKLRVYGVKNLRVADCSIIPVTISGHTNAVAIMIGEKISDFIKWEYGEKCKYCEED